MISGSLERINEKHAFAALAVIARILGGVTLVMVAAEDMPPRTPFGSFELRDSSEWSRVEPDRPKTAAMLLLNGTVWNA